MTIYVVKANEPRLDIQPNRQYIAMMGGSDITTKKFKADTASASQINWSVTTPSVRTGMSRRVEIEIPFSVTVTGAAAADTIAEFHPNVLTAGLRQYPVHSLCEVLNYTLNDHSTSYEPASIIHAMLNYGNDAEDRQYFMGASPHKPDTFYSYEQTGGSSGTKNPFTTYFNSEFEDGRGLGSWTISTDPPTVGGPSVGGAFVPATPRSATVNFVLRETLMISPFYWGKQDYQALFGVQNFDLSLTLSNLNRLLSGAAGGILSDANTAIFETTNAPNVPLTNYTVSVGVGAECNLHLTFITPSPQNAIPNVLHYPYYGIRRYQTNPVTLGANASGTVLFNSVTLHEVPSRIYVFLRPRIENLSTQVDFFAIIEQIRFNFDNQDGRLSTLDSFDLWKVSTDNGLKRTWLEWSKYYGSVLCLQMGKDITLNPLLCSGVRGNFQLSFELTARNPTPSPVNFTPILVTIPEGVMTFADNLVSTSLGTITQQDVADAPMAPGGLRQQVNNYYGGNIWNDIYSGIKSVGKVALPIARNIASAVEDVASAIPHPMGFATSIGARGVRKALGGKKVGGRKSGGALMSSADLARRL